MTTLNIASTGMIYSPRIPEIISERKLTMSIDSIIATLATDFGKPGLSTKRAIGADEVREAFTALPQAKKRIRVYSAQGFVPGRYRYKCLIQYVEAHLVDGEWQWSSGWTGAQRSRGIGTRVVVQ